MDTTVRMEQPNHRGTVTTTVPELSRSPYRPALPAVPEWARVPQIVTLFGIGRSSLYGLIRSGQIASRVVKTSRHNISGIRLVNTESVRAFIEAAPSSVEEAKAGAA